MNNTPEYLAEPLQRSKLWDLLFTGDFTKNWVAKEAFFRALKRRLARCTLNRFVVVLGDNPFAERDIVVLLRDLNASISEWQSDLDWLKSRFYTGRFDQSFGWPNT
jgi:hypothetical protein